jgi:hypothetical protein
MIKAEIFDAASQKEDQRKAEMQMLPIERLYLCLDLMDMMASVSRNRHTSVEADTLPWIELRLKNAK